MYVPDWLHIALEAPDAMLRLQRFDYTAFTSFGLSDAVRQAPAELGLLDKVGCQIVIRSSHTSDGLK